MALRQSRCRSPGAWRVGVLAHAVLLSGCIVGIVSVRTPERLPAAALPPLPQRLSFDVCPSVNLPRPLTAVQADHVRDARKRLADRIRGALSLAGVDAELVRAGSPAHFTVTEVEKAFEHDGTFLLSLLTFSVLPGYMETVSGLQVALSVRDPQGAIQFAPLRYEAAVRVFTWLPLIVYPDLVGNMGGGWESAKSKAADGVALDGMILRLADDLRERLGRDPVPWAEREARGAFCPMR